MDIQQEKIMTLAESHYVKQLLGSAFTTALFEKDTEKSVSLIREAMQYVCKLEEQTYERRND
jgi:hypothetical protein